MPFEEQPKTYFQTWCNFFQFKYAEPEDSNELFQKLLENLKELAEYDKSTSKDHPIILSDDDEGHSVQDKESLENPSDEIVVSNPGEEKETEATTDTELLSTKNIQPLPVQDKLHDSNIHQLIEECSINIYEERKKKMESTVLELIDTCRQKEILCMHDNVDDLIESALDTKLLLINSINSQRLYKKEHEVKNVVEPPDERRNHAEKSLQNFRVIHKSSISLNSSQISSVHAVAPISSTKEPEHSLSMGYEHLSITPETESNEVTESNAKNLLPIPSECKVTSEDKKECDVPICENSSTVDVCDNHSEILFDSNNDDLSSDDESFEDIKYVDASTPDPEIVSEEEENVVHQEEQEVDLEEIQDIVLREKLFSINRLISNIEYFERQSFAQETRSDNTTTHANYSLPEYDSFRFEIEPDQENMNNISDNPSNDPLLEEVDLFLAIDHSIPPGIENFYDPEGDIRFLEALLINESSDDPSIPRPPPEPPDDNFDLEPEAISAVMENNDEPDESFDLGEEIFVSTKNGDVDYFSFMSVMRIFMPYLVLPEISPLFLSAESEDTVFDPDISV
nr:hypothetical protein [Tanacetum cinerariifolium]